MENEDTEVHPLLVVPFLQVLGGCPMSVLWVVGDTWVRCEYSQYTIGADEPATPEQVEALLASAGGHAYEWTES